MRLIRNMLMGVAIVWVALVIVFLIAISVHWFAETFGPAYGLIALFSMAGAAFGALADQINKG